MSCRLRFILLAAAWLALGAVQGIAADPTAPSSTPVGDRGQFQNRVFSDAEGDHRYVVFVPPGYDPARRWPVILSLHGAGERGNDGRRQLTVGLGPVVEMHPEEFPAIIIFPQVEETDERILTAWSPRQPDGRRALQILADVERRFAIDPRRRILTGWSMGGYGVWQIAAASEPGFWSAALSVSGGAEAGIASNLPAGLPLWAIHGADDRLVEPARMQQAADAARRTGRHVASTIIDGAGHDIWRIVYGRDEVRQWMFDASAVDPDALDWSDDTIARLKERNALPDRPFRASAVISRAVAIRIGNGAFEELARGIPEAIPPERLQGDVADIEKSVAYGGTTIQAGIRNITWTAELAAAHVDAIEAERLLIRVGLKDLTLHSTGGDLKGGQYEASCGPFDVILGRSRPVWVEVSTRPRVIDGKILLTERDIRFSIPDDNWLVTEPEWAKARGEGLTPELVKVGIVGGMYRAKDQVEAAVCELIPPLIERIERRLVQVPPDSLASMLWPLPTSPPRIRLVPQGIRTDSAGVSVTVGLAVEGPSAPAEVPVISTPTPIREGKSDGALVGIAPPALNSVAAMFADAPSARLDVRDAPDSPLTRLADETVLRDVAPGLREGGIDYELRAVMSTPEPFTLEIHSEKEQSRTLLNLLLKAPTVLLEISRRPRDGSGTWQRCVEGRFSIRQGLSIELNGEQPEGRVISIHWDPESEIEGTASLAGGFSPSDQSLDNDRLVREFSSAWRDWTMQAGTTSRVEDLAVGPARLRLNAVPVRGGRIWLEFEPLHGRNESPH